MVLPSGWTAEDRNLLLLLFQKASDDKMVDSLTAAVHVGGMMGVEWELCTFGSGLLKCVVVDAFCFKAQTLNCHSSLFEWVECRYYCV